MLEGWLTGSQVTARLGEQLTQRLLRFVEENAASEASMQSGGPCLSHSDYKPWNMLVREGTIAAVLDWEFAFANAPLNDIGNFLRYSARSRRCTNPASSTATSRPVVFCPTAGSAWLAWSISSTCVPSWIARRMTRRL